MGQDEKICRLCLQIIGKDYFAIINNDAVLQNLNLISPNTAKNIELTEEPLICGQCNNKLKQLANFKESVISNEFKLQCHQKTDLEAFLETLADDTTTICRLCLKAAGLKWKLTNSWQDNKQLFSQCNIHMNVNVVVPAKICNGCCVALQKMGAFISLCLETENLIADRAAKKGKLSFEDLLAISMDKSSTSKKAQTEDINNDPCKGETIKEKSSSEKSNSSSASIKVEKHTMSKNNSIIKYMTPNKSRNEAEITKLKPEEESLSITKTPNTYQSKKSKKKTIPGISVDMPSTSQAGLSTDKLTDRKFILKKMNEQLRRLHTSIDATPVSDLTDITLNANNEGLMLEEPTNEFNVTQELIDVLEGRLNDKEINFATQELLDVLEGRSDDTADNVEGELFLKVEVETKAQINNSVVKKGPFKTHSKLSKEVNILDVVTIPRKNEPKNYGSKSKKAAQSSNSTTENKSKGLKQGTIITSFKNILAKNNESIESGTVNENPDGKTVMKNSAENKPTEEPKKAKRINKTNENNEESAPLKKRVRKAPQKNDDNSETSSQNPATRKAPQKEAQGAKGVESEANTEQPLIPNEAPLPAKRKTYQRKDQVVKTEIEPVLKIAPAAQNPNESSSDDEFMEAKRINKTNENSEESAPLKKRVRKAPKKKDDNTETSSQNPATRKAPQKEAQGAKGVKSEANTEQPLILNKAPLHAKKKTYQRKYQVVKTEIEPVLKIEPAAQNPEESSSDDEFVEESNKKLQVRNLTVTIIKSQKKTKKAELDKTWQELTGKPVDTKSVPNATKEEKKLVEVPTIVRRRRGRPPLPADKAKKKKVKKVVTWIFCDLCPFKTYARNSFIQHQLIHNVRSSMPILHCNVCRFTSTNKEMLDQHMASHAAISLVYKCVFCEEVSKRKTSCMYHTLKHDDQDVASQFYCMVYNEVTEEEYFECFQCEYQSVEETPMPDHVIDHTIETAINPIVAKFKCHQCSYITKSEEFLKRHIELHNKPDKKKKGKKTEPVNQDPSPPQVEPSLGPLLQCNQCHYMTRQKRSLANHIGVKHKRKYTQAVTGSEETEGEKIYCNECAYTTTKKIYMVRHSLVHRNKNTMEFFECPHCLFETKHRRSYTRHMETLHGIIV